MEITLKRKLFGNIMIAIIEIGYNKHNENLKGNYILM